MDKLIDTEFHSALEASLSGSAAVDADNSDNLWREFAGTVESLCTGSASAYSQLRRLFRFRTELQSMLFRAREKSDPFCVRLLEKSIMTLDNEVELVNLCIRYPHISPQCPQLKSELFLCQDYSQTDLIEIIDSLHSMHFARRGTDHSLPSLI